MSPSFEISADVERSLLWMKLVGFFDIPTVRQLATARNAALARMRCGPNQHMTLCDAREGMVSVPTVATEFQRLFTDPRYVSRRVAYLTPLALGRVQVSRTLQHKSLAFFTEEAPALAWLFAEEDVGVRSARA